ncbi:ABC transporter permease [Bacillus freudenreichii]|nr:ABC transporter permease [Bacillus freudenreichii]
MKWFRILLAIGLTGFLIANLVLISKENSKVNRINHITDWSKIRKTDIVESLPVDGVITQAETYYVLASEDETIEEFLVGEGDTVEEGTPLLLYKSDKIDRQTALLDAEIESLQSKRNSVQSLINQLKSLTPPVSSRSSNADLYYDEDYSDWYYPNPSDHFNEEEWKQANDKEIGEKTFEMEKLEADIKKLESQRDSLQSDKDSLSLTSPISGVVKKITPDSKKVITIVSDEKILKGELQEEQLPQVDEGMKVNILSHLFEGRLTGEIDQISKLPADRPGVKKKSIYPFTAAFDEENEDIHIGYHVTADIILEEEKDVPAVLGKSIGEKKDTSYIWVLNESGIAEKRKITTGLEVGNLYAINNGAKAGEFYVTDHRQAVKQAPFITPLDVYKLNKSSAKEISRKKAIKYFFIGVLQQ